MNQKPVITELMAEGDYVNPPDEAGGEMGISDPELCAVQCECILIQNVVDYAIANPSIVPPLQEIPALIPPHPQSIYELGPIKAECQDPDGEPMGWLDTYCAALIMRQRIHENHRAYSAAGGPKGWRLKIGWIFGAPRQGATLQHGENVYVDETGAMVDCNVSLLYDKNQKCDHDRAARVMQFSRMLLFAIGLMNCRNTRLVPRTIKPPRKTKRKSKLNHPKYKIRAHTLHVDPIRKVYTGEGDTRPRCADTSLHICRGHFKDFRTGPGLFGRHHGIYWWEMQARGSKAAGVVEKEYQVEAPAS